MMAKTRLPKTPRSLTPKLVVVLLCCCLTCDWFATRTCRQAEAVQALNAISGCQVTYNDGETPQPIVDLDQIAKMLGAIPQPAPATKSWAERVLGKDFVRCATKIEVALGQVDKVLPHLERLPDLREVSILLGSVDDLDVERDRQAELAKAKINASLPRVAVTLVSFDFNIPNDVKLAAQQAEIRTAPTVSPTDSCLCGFTIEWGSYGFDCCIPASPEACQYVAILSTFGMLF